MVMDQTDVNIIPLVRKRDNGEKAQKCNQCEYTSFYANKLRTHLKTHSGEKPNKCIQCSYASYQEGDLRKHLKIHSGKNQTNATNGTMHPQF